jgi:hypothetical protein
MRRRTLIASTLAALALLAPSPAALANPPTATTSTTTPAATQPAPSAASTPGPGIQIGPPAPAPQPPSNAGGGTVSGGGSHGPAWWQFWNVSGQIGNAIDGWFRGLVTDALNPMLDLIGKTVLATPQVTGQSAVAQIWLISLGIADGLLVLFLLAAGALLMTNETLHTRYALKDALPRIAVGAIAANASLSLSGQLISFANALSAGFLAGGVDPTQASAQLKGFILGAVANSGIFVILLGLVAAVLAVVLLILYIIRATVVLILIAGAPLLLITHALPQTDGLARLWWRGMTAALGVQVAQALVLATAVRVFFNVGGRQALGLSVTGSLIDLLVCLCLFWILIRIPFWAKDLAFSGHRTMVGQAARTYVLARVGRKALLS